MKNAYDILRDKHQQEVNEFPFGFAFGDKQFDEMMRKWGLCHGRDGKPTDNDCRQILHIGSGGYVRKEDAAAMHEMFDRHSRELKEAIEADPDGTGFIYYMFLSEMYNHEYGYTGDIGDTLYALGLTGEDIENDERLATGLKKAQEVVFNES